MLLFTNAGEIGKNRNSYSLDATPRVFSEEKGSMMTAAGKEKWG